MSRKKSLTSTSQLTAMGSVTDRIRFIRGEKVMLDEDLAELYGVKTKVLNQAVSRNSDRFPSDFMFKLTFDEVKAMRFQIGTASELPKFIRSQIVTASKRNVRYLPLAFTEQGVAMLSSVLRSKRAVQVNIAIMRAFIQLRSVLAAHKVLARKIAELELKTDTRFEVITKLIRHYLPNPKKSNKIGFRE